MDLSVGKKTWRGSTEKGGVEVSLGQMIQVWDGNQRTVARTDTSLEDHYSFCLLLCPKTGSSNRAEIRCRANPEPYFSSLGSDPFSLLHRRSSLWLLCSKGWYLHLVDHFKSLQLFVEWVNFSSLLWPVFLLYFLFFFFFFSLIWFLFPTAMGLDSMIPSWGNWTYVAFNFFRRKEQLN